MSSAAMKRAASRSWTDEEVVSRILAGDTELFETIIRRYNQRLYRVAFCILRNEGDAEDAMEEGYVRAYQHLDQFAGRAKFATWLTRIVVNEALALKRRSNRYESLDGGEGEESRAESLASAAPNPEQLVLRRELAASLDRAILALPENYRLVFVLREVQGLDTAETAECLGLTQENVKVRLLRARAALRQELAAAGNASEALPAAANCPHAMVTSVLARLRSLKVVPALRA